MISFFLFHCTPQKIDTADTSVDEPNMMDADGDGFFSSGVHDDLIDCDDQNPKINPQTHRYIPAGTFIRGWEHNHDTAPVMEITLSSYCIGVYEVQNQDFVVFMNEQRELGWENSTQEGQPLFDFEDNDDPYPERILDNGNTYTVQEGYENHPVVEVYRWSAQAYCMWAGHQLPTEAQWERAARGDEGAMYPWGDEQADCSKSNFWPQNPPQEPCVDDTTPVGSYAPGAWGLYDMAGNVSEWVEDWYQVDYYAQSPAENPTGPENGWAEDPMNPEGFIAATARGGSLGSGSGSLRSFHRVPEPLEATSNGLGFRCSFFAGE